MDYFSLHCNGIDINAAFQGYTPQIRLEYPPIPSHFYTHTTYSCVGSIPMSVVALPPTAL